MPPERKLCACGCGRIFLARNPRYRYAHKPKKGQHYQPGERALRKRLQANPPNGHPCPRCGQPMTRAQHQAGLLDTGHVIDKALGGRAGLRWEHRACNRRAGAQLGVALRRTPRTVTPRRPPAW